MHKNLKNLLMTTVFISYSYSAYADICPPPPGAVSPSVSSNVVYDKKTQIYKYSYSLKNGVSARIPLDYFGLLINQAPSGFKSPAKWKGEFISLSPAPDKFGWITSEVKEAEADIVTGDANLPSPAYALQPGKTLNGFEVYSPNPPGVVQFFAEGFTQPPTVTATEENSEPTPNCPEWDFESPKLQTQVTGMTIGPSDPNVVSVKIRAREQSGTRACGQIRPKNPSGKMTVLVLSSQSFDAGQIDVSSVIFGPGYASPVSSKLVPGGIGESIGRDERADWEKLLESLDKDSSKKKSSFKNLLLTFDVAALDVQCNLDQALFLRGKTKADQKFVGAVSIELADCKEKETGRHRKGRHSPFKWWENKKEVKRSR